MGFIFEIYLLDNYRKTITREGVQCCRIQSATMAQADLHRSTKQQTSTKSRAQSPNIMISIISSEKTMRIQVRKVKSKFLLLDIVHDKTHSYICLFTSQKANQFNAQGGWLTPAREAEVRMASIHTSLRSSRKTSKIGLHTTRRPFPCCYAETHNIWFIVTAIYVDIYLYMEQRLSHFYSAWFCMDSKCTSLLTGVTMYVRTSPCSPYLSTHFGSGAPWSRIVAME